MEDVQNRPDSRRMRIDKVGVSDVLYPIVVLDKQHRTQQTVARVSISVDLPEDFKGTHMSRLIEILNQHRGEITMRTLPGILREIKSRLCASAAHIDLRFPYFVERLAPVSRAAALMDYECWFSAESTEYRDDFILGVRVPITTVCPCSKAISDYGAHNQRGHVGVEVRGCEGFGQGGALIWIEEIIAVVEDCASAPVYPLLKRPDERYVTMQAYENPVFVEDVVRDVAMAMKSDERVAWFHIHVKNQESIHNHNAFAQIEWSRRDSEPLTMQAEVALPCEI